MAHLFDIAGFVRFLAASSRTLAEIDAGPGLHAALVALGLAVLARLVHRPLLAAASAAGGLSVAWWAMFGGVQSAPHMLPNRVALVGPAALVAALLIALRPRLGSAVTVALALFSAWWLGGAPHGEADLLAALPAMAGTALYTFVLCRLMRSGVGAAIGAAILPAALVLARAGMVWKVIAMVPLGAALGAALGTLAAPVAEEVGLAVAAGVGVAGAGAVLAEGRLPLGGIGPVDLAAAAPLAALWLAPQLAPRFARFGKAAETAAFLAAGVLVLLAGAAAAFF